jgi:hypothetical protein
LRGAEAVVSSKTPSLIVFLFSLAYAEMRLIMAKLVWNFDFELDPRSQDWIEQNKVYLLWEKPQLFIRLKPRKRQGLV